MFLIVPRSTIISISIYCRGHRECILSLCVYFNFCDVRLDDVDVKSDDHVSNQGQMCRGTKKVVISWKDSLKTVY